MAVLALHDVPAPAKLNLFLHVVGRRADGYHLLQSLFVFVDWGDTLHFERRRDGLLRRHDFGDPLPDDDLCLRAARLLQAESGTAFGADIAIEKRVPSGAGMGGGSSDAASTLLALNRLWGVDWPRERLLGLGLRLGADVPFFVGGRNAFVEGIGERLTPVALASRAYAVVKPPRSIETKAIFASPLLGRSDDAGIIESFAEVDRLPDGCGQRRGSERGQKRGPERAQGWTVSFDAVGKARNDLELAARAACEQVVQASALLEAAYGRSRMTGSGSAVFSDLGPVEDVGMGEGVAALPPLPEGWLGRICRGLAEHPLLGWAQDAGPRAPREV